MNRATMLNSGVLAVLGMLACVLTSAATAQDDEGGDAGVRAQPLLSGKPWFFSPMFSYTLPDGARGTEAGIGASLALGKQLLDGLAVELNGFTTKMDAETGDGSAKLYGVGVSALVFPSTHFPNVYGVLGASYGSAKGHPGPVPDYKSFVLDTGVGLLYPIYQDILLRADVRFRLDQADDKDAGTSANEDRAFYDDVFSVGVLLPLGKTAAAPAPVAAVVPVAGDADNDGVLDGSDDCPGTPAGAVVNERGCELDSDGDGVPDRADQCPDTPKGVAVNEVGCPLDSDGDGVPDTNDECPDTPAGAKVLNNGCTLTVGKKFVLRGVKFDFDSDRLTEAAKNILTEVAATMQAYPDVKVELEGHTCNIGTADYNLRLSDRRAASTQRFLTGKGVAAERMTTVGYGLTQPVASNDTPEGQEKNRRVEMKVLEGSPADAAGAAAAEDAPAEQVSETSDDRLSRVTGF